MDQESVEKFAFTNLPSQVCAITGKPIVDPVIMRMDLSDWWPVELHNMRDDRLVNLRIVDREARDRYYDRIKNLGVVIALSGGLDSTTVLHWCLRLFGKVHCLIFDYGQRHSIEIESACSYVDRLLEIEENQGRLKRTVVDMSPINALGSSALTRSIEVPANRSDDDMTNGIPATFVPGRNVYFVTALAQVAYQEGWRHAALGVNILDYSGYPDCRPKFLDAMRAALREGIFNGIDFAIHAPLMFLNKKQIIRLGMHLGVDYSATHSCYNGIKGGCGTCDSCILRRRAFVELGTTDPAIV